MYSIRLATEDDIPGILEIENEAFSPPWTHGSLLGEIYRDGSFFAVAQCKFGIPNSEFISGFIILRRMGDDGEVLQIAVEKDSRRRGVADMLMDAAFLYAKESELKSVYLEVRKGNDAAVALYKKHGFITVRRRKGYYSDPVEDAIVMARDII